MELEPIQNKIYEIRGYRVMLDFDLAGLYGVETKNLKRAVRRNIERFPLDFMFELTKAEWDEVVPICHHPLKYSYIAPFAFTQDGVAMLSSVLHSPMAIQTNIKIMRAFTILRQYVLGYAELKQKLDHFMLETNMQFSEIYQALIELAEQKKKIEAPRNPIGFKTSRDQN